VDIAERAADQFEHARALRVEADGNQRLEAAVP
jgi:hypothetical protein